MTELVSSKSEDTLLFNLMYYIIFPPNVLQKKQTNTVLPFLLL